MDWVVVLYREKANGRGERDCAYHIVTCSYISCVRHVLFLLRLARGSGLVCGMYFHIVRQVFFLESGKVEVDWVVVLWYTFTFCVLVMP